MLFSDYPEWRELPAEVQYSQVRHLLTKGVLIILLVYSTDDKLHFGTILCFLGLRYKSYCSNIVRTMFVQPSKVFVNGVVANEVTVRIYVCVAY